MVKIMRHYFGPVRRLPFIATLILLTLMCLFSMNFVSLFSKTVILTPLSRPNSTLSRESQLMYDETIGQTPLCVDLPPWQVEIVQKSKSALIAGKRVSEKKHLVLGIASVWRSENYLQQTLSSLVQQSNDEERQTAVVVIYLADSNQEKNAKQLDVIKSNFQKYLDSGFFQVIQSVPEIYPPMDFVSFKRTFNDSKERVLWRTKQVIDFVFLMTYAHPLGDFYMVVEDDVVASNQYLTAISEFISTRREKRWAALQFTGFLGIGLLFRSSDLPQLTQLLLMFHQNQPIDMLMRQFIGLQVQESNLIVRRIPSLMNHIGVKSSLPNKIQKLTDNTFNMADRQYKNHNNPPADLVTSMKVYNDFFPEYAYRATPGFFWGVAKNNDTLDIVFHSPVQITKFVLISGLTDPKTKLKDPIKDGILEIGDKFQKISSNNVAICDKFRKLQNFQDNIVLNSNFSAQCIRIRIGPGQKSWVIIREIQGTIGCDPCGKKIFVLLYKIDMVDKPRSSGTSSTNSVSLPSRAIVTIFKILAKLIVKLWRWASSFVALIFFLAFYYGGILPYVVGCVAILSLAYHLSDSLLYQPDTPVEARLFVPSPNSYGLPFESVDIKTQDRIKLHSFLIKQPVSRNCITILFFHGNAGNIGHRLDNAKLLYKTLKCNILLVEYRGYGHSEGTPSEEGFYLDAQAAYDFVDGREDLDSTKIVLFGRSLGSAVAVDLAAQSHRRDLIAALIIENTFTSIPDIAKVLFPVKFVRWIPRFFFKNLFESSKKIPCVVCPTLFLSGLKDELIPSKHMDDLFKRCCSNIKRLKKFPDGSHNDTWHSKDYIPTLKDFLQEVLSSTKETKYEPSYSDDIV